MGKFCLSCLNLLFLKFNELKNISFYYILDLFVPLVLQPVH
jgi:hypothetical protein